MTFYRLWDNEEMEYALIREDFAGIQEFLANEWENDLYPATDMYEDMYDKIMAATTQRELEEFADGLGYSIEEGEEVK